MSSENLITRVGAYGLILERDQILLCRISSQLPYLAGKWTLPGGGIEFREDPVDAMIREVREETGLRVDAAGLAAVDSNAVDTDHGRYHGIRIIYHTQLLGGELANEVDGTTDLCAWWSIDETRNLDLVDLAAAGIRLCKA